MSQALSPAVQRRATPLNADPLGGGTVRMAWTSICAMGALVAFIGGCASFTERPTRDSFRGPDAPVPLRLSRSGEAKLQVTSERWMGMPNIGGFDSEAATAIWRTGWFREPEDDESALVLRVHVSDHQGMGPPLLSTASAFLIPGTIDHQLRVELFDESTGESKPVCSRRAVVRTWYQTFLLFAYPFRAPSWNRMKTVEILAENCLAEVLQSAGPRGDERDAHL